jgi:hypothetical protein
VSGVSSLVGVWREEKRGKKSVCVCRGGLREVAHLLCVSHALERLAAARDVSGARSQLINGDDKLPRVALLLKGKQLPHRSKLGADFRRDLLVRNSLRFDRNTTLNQFPKEA